MGKEIEKQQLLKIGVVAGLIGIGVGTYLYLANKTENESSNKRKRKRKTEDGKTLEIPDTPINTDFIFEGEEAYDDGEKHKELEITKEQKKENENQTNQKTKETKEEIEEEEAKMNQENIQEISKWIPIQYQYRNENIGIEINLPKKLQMTKAPRLGVDGQTVFEIESLVKKEEHIARSITVIPSRGTIPIEMYIELSLARYKKMTDIQLKEKNSIEIDGQEGQEIIIFVPSAFGAEKLIYTAIVCMERKIVTFNHETTTTNMKQMKKELKTMKELIQKVKLLPTIARGNIRVTTANGISLELPQEYTVEDVTNENEIVFAAIHKRDDQEVQARLVIIQSEAKETLNKEVEKLVKDVKKDKHVKNLTISDKNLTLEHLEQPAKLFVYKNEKDGKEQHVFCGVFQHETQIYQMVVHCQQIDKDRMMNVLRSIQFGQQGPNLVYTLPEKFSIALPTTEEIIISEPFSNVALVNFHSTHFETHIRRICYKGKTPLEGITKLDISNTSSIYHPTRRTQVTQLTYAGRPALKFQTLSFPNTEYEIIHFVVLIAETDEEGYLMETLVLKSHYERNEETLQPLFDTIHDAFELLSIN